MAQLGEVVDQLRRDLVELDQGVSVGVWYSVFHNRYGERWVYAYCRQTDETFIGGDDTNWENWNEIIDAFSLQREEAIWMGACGRIVSHMRKDRERSHDVA